MFGEILGLDGRFAHFFLHPRLLHVTRAITINMTFMPRHHPGPGCRAFSSIADISFTQSPTTSPVQSATEQKSSSGSTPIVAGVVSAVAGAVLIALAVILKKRRSQNQKTTRTPAVTPSHGDDNVEQGQEPPGVCPPPHSAVVAAGNKDENLPSHLHITSPHQQTPAEADGADGAGIAPPSAPALPIGQVQSSAEDAKSAAEGRSTGSAGDDAASGSAEKLSAATPSAATSSTTNISTAEQDELAQFHQRERVADAASVAGGPNPIQASGSGTGASSAASRQSSAGDIGLARAVLAAAQELAHHCQIPGVSEAATAVCIMANLATDSHDNVRASESRLRQCRSIVIALKRAANVADKVS